MSSTRLTSPTPTTADDERFMRLAIQQAALARQNGDVPFGAVIVQGGQVIVATHNREHLDRDVTSHAETNAIREAHRTLGRRDLSDCTLYSSNELCLMCASAALTAFMPRILYALSRDDLPMVFRPRQIRLEQLLQDTLHAPEVVAGLLRDEALPLYDGIVDPFRVQPLHVKVAPPARFADEARPSTIEPNEIHHLSPPRSA